MSKFAKIANVKHYKDRHGKERNYFRVAGKPDVPMPTPFGSPEFMAAWYALMSGNVVQSPQHRIIKRLRGEGVVTTGEAIARYLESTKFSKLAPLTAKQRRTFLGKFAAAADVARAPLTVHTTASLAACLKGKPDNTIRAQIIHLRGLFGWCVMPVPAGPGLLKDDPAAGLCKPEANVDPDAWREWTEQEIAQYRAHWPLGTPARLALELYLATGARGSDVIELGWHSYREAETKLAYRTKKTDTPVLIDVLPELAEALALVERPAPTATLLHPPFFHRMTKDGPKGYSRLTQLMKGWSAAAGLPDDCVPHGLRRAMVQRLERSGANEFEIGAVTGQTAETVFKYVRSRGRAAAAGRAMAKLRRE